MIILAIDTPVHQKIKVKYAEILRSCDRAS